MSSSRVHVTLTGAPPISRDSSAASIAKSHLDLRPKPPPSSVTLTVTFSGDMPSFLATSSRVPCGLCTQAQTSHLPSAICDGRGRRLHRGVRQMRDVVLGLELSRRRRQRALDIAFVAHDLARVARRLLELLPVGCES